MEQLETQLYRALKELYEVYVVDMHGERTCDCDPSVGICECAPCNAQAAMIEYEHKHEQ